MSRPWSPVEVEEKIPEIVDKLHDAIGQVEELGERAAEASHRAKKSRALAWVTLEFEKGTLAAKRDAMADLWVNPDHSESVVDLEFAADLADKELRAMRLRINALEKEADLLQSMHVSHRQAKT